MSKRRRAISVVLLVLLGAGCGTSPRTGDQRAALPPAAPVAFDQALFGAMRFRMIGPYRGSRSTAVAGIRAEPHTFFMAPASGGVWKSTDAGESWDNVSDGFLRAGSVGAIAIADSDPRVMFVGTGSACIRGNVSPGIGVYRSVDGGRSWEHAGLPEAGQISRVRIHPTDPRIVYVAAVGHAFGPNDERGIFKSTDGGTSWRRVLFVSNRTGAADLDLDRKNPRVMYAAMWTAERKPWDIISGSAESGLFKSTDGGETWTKLVVGLPSGVVGRIGVAVSPVDSRRVWALVEAEEGGLFRSDDAGATFVRMNQERNLRERPWYYMHVYADPKDRDTVYVASLDFLKSTDGGASFSPIASPHGDHHDFWINPDDPRIVIQANDGGANVSLTGGLSWSTQLNQPTAEIYRVTVDNQFPYRVYGAEQDQWVAISLPSRSASFGAKLHLQYWDAVGGMEGGHVAVDWSDPNIVYAGGPSGLLTRHDRRTGQTRPIKPYPEVSGTAGKNLRYRYQWNAPVRVSPHDAKTIYHMSNHVHVSADGGQSWRVISPDLTRNDKDKQNYTGNPITRDQTTAEIFGTVYAFEESPIERNVLWAGSDDGLVHVSRDGGGRWEKVTPAAMPEWGTVNAIDVSRHAPGRAFIAVHRYRLDDFAPYAFRTDDYGKSWTRIADGRNGIPPTHFVRVVREDPDRRGLLYAGTEFGLYVSFDDGKTWQPFQLNLPIVPVTDLVLHQKDLVVATQGRSFWLLDDLSPLHQLTPDVLSAGAHLFTPRAAYRVRTSEDEADDAYLAGAQYVSHLRDMLKGARIDRSRTGEEAPQGATISTYFADVPDGPVTLDIVDSGGQVVRTYSSATPDRSLAARLEAPWRKSAGTFWKQGFNRLVWDLRTVGPEVSVGTTLERGRAKGPLVMPGEYTVRLTVGGRTETANLDVLKDPRVDTTPDDYRRQFELLIAIRDQVAAVHRGLVKLRTARDAGDRPAALLEQFNSLERSLVATPDDYRLANLDQPPKLLSELTYLDGYVAAADARPTDGAVERFEDLRKRVAASMRAIDQIATAGRERTSAAGPGTGTRQ